jgi:hypothetical protein
MGEPYKSLCKMNVRGAAQPVPPEKINIQMRSREGEGGFGENNRRDAPYQCTHHSEHTHVQEGACLPANNGKIFYLLIFNKSAEVEREKFSTKGMHTMHRRMILLISKMKKRSDCAHGGKEMNADSSAAATRIIL